MAESSAATCRSWPTPSTPAPGRPGGGRGRAARRLRRPGRSLPAPLAAYPGLILIGVDADLTAIELSRDLLSADAGRVTLVHSFYDEIPAIVAAAGLDSVQGVLFDLGVSSPQLDDPERGFAYSYDAPLDMRMDRTSELTAAEVVNRYPAEELARVLRDYGEERFARRIADAVVRERSRSPVTSTGRLSEIVRKSVPAAARRTGGHPAKRTFQALRIEVNGELTVLGRACSPPSACSRWAGGSSSSPTTRSKTARSSGGLPRPPPTPPRPACRCRCPGAGRSSAC